MERSDQMKVGGPAGRIAPDGAEKFSASAPELFAVCESECSVVVGLGYPPVRKFVPVLFKEATGTLERPVEVRSDSGVGLMKYDEVLANSTYSVSSSQYAQEEVVVLPTLQVFVESHVLEDCRPEGHAGKHSDYIIGSELVVGNLSLPHIRYANHLSISLESTASEHTVAPATVRAEGGEDSFEMLRMKLVVGVEKGHELTAREVDAGVPGSVCPSLIWKLVEVDTRVVEALNDIGDLVGRAVVDHDEFEVRVSLGENAADGPREHIRAVVCRNHHRERRSRGSVPGPGRA